MGTKCTQFLNSRKFFCSVIQGLMGEAVDIGDRALRKTCGLQCNRRLERIL
jgi:hypothetical protein